MVVSSGHGRLIRDSAINLAGQGLPLIAAIVAFPLLINGLGPDRFGVLALAWVLVGYASLFDFGLGRALTQQVAQRLGSGRIGEVPALAWTGLAIMTVAGVVVAAILAAAAPWLVTSGLKIPAALQAETLEALRILCLSIPFVTCSAGLRGLLEARQRFGLVNIVRAALGTFTFLGPAAVLPYSNDLGSVMWLLLAVRAGAWVASLVLCLREIPGLRAEISVRRELVASLLSVGGWITVSNIVGPVIVYLDRFLIGALLSAAAVAYYVTPYEIITRLLILPAAFAAVLFPEFAASSRGAGHAASLYSSALKYTFVFLFPVVLIVLAFAPEALAWWLGREFAEQSATVARVLAVGVLLNSLAQVPFTLAQATGRADWVARLHLVELVVYIPALYAAIMAAGIVGAAVAWSARVAVDLAVMAAMARRLLPMPAASVSRLWLGVIVCSGALAGAWLVPGPATRAWFVAVVLIAFVVISWRSWLSQEEKAGLRAWLT